MGLKAPKLSLILVAAAFSLSCFGFTLFVWKSFGGPTPFQAHGYRFHVVFGTEASQMTANADVRISGVNVGKVIEVQRRGVGADVLVEIDDEFAPVPRDTRAIVRFKSLLGEAFVALTPGSRDAPELKEDGTLPATNIGRVEQVDEVLGAFDEPTRKAFTRFLRDTAEALDQRGPDINAGLGHLAPTAESVSDILLTLDRQKASLRSLIRDSGVALRATAERQDDLRSIVSAGNQIFAATASRNESLTATVEALPSFLRETRAALREIDAAAADAAPTLRALRPVVPLLRPALVEAARLAPVLGGTFDDLGPTITAARRGLPALTRILIAARPALRTLYLAGRQLIPIADYLGLYRNDLVAAVSRVATAVNYDIPTSDGGTQKILRALIAFNDESQTNASQRLGANRTNPYPLPGALDRIEQGSGLQAIHCRNVDNPQTVPVIGQPPPPCQVAPQLDFRGQLRSYPHVELDGP